MMNLRFDSVFYYVRDLDAAISFYTGALGLRLRSRDAVARLDIDGVLLELVPTGDDTKVSGQGNARLCFAVEDVKEAAALLGKRHVAVDPVRAVGNGFLAAFRDPDGNELALWQYTQK